MKHLGFIYNNDDVGMRIYLVAKENKIIDSLTVGIFFHS